MIRRIVLLLVCTFLLNNVRAQNVPGTISGKVLDKEGKAAVSANVVLLKEDNKLVKADLTTDKGMFLIDGVAEGAYTIKITLSGFQVYTSEKFTLSGNYVLPDVVLEEKAGELKEVAVRGQKPFIEVQADKLVVNVENSIVSAGSSALEILQRSPGVTVDQSDNISLKGKPGVTIMIDGKISPIAGSDLANVLKSMPASAIDKIEIISNPGARYDAAGTGGIINIKTKRDKRMGINGSVNTSYAQGVYPKYGAGFNLSYRNKRITVNLSYNYAYRLWYNHLMLDRNFLDLTKENNDSSYIQDNHALFDFSNHIGSIGVDYMASKATTIGFSINAGSNKFSPKADNYSTANGPGDNRPVLYHFNTTGRHHNKYADMAANVYLRHSFDSLGRELSIDLDYAGFWNQSNQHFSTLYTDPKGNPIPGFLPYYMNSDLSGLTQIRSFKADYSNPFKSGIKLDLGIKTSYVTSDNEPLFYEWTGITFNTPPIDSFILDKTRSNHFLYKENINAAYINFAKEGEKWSTQLGLRLEQTNVIGDQLTSQVRNTSSYAQLFPSIAVQRHINKTNDLGLSVSRRIERPNYQQLNPFKYFIDKTTYSEGYPALGPATSYAMELSHTFKQRFITTLTYSLTSDVIIQTIQPSETDGDVKITVQTTKNLHRMNFYGISGSYNTDITKWWNNVTNFNAYYASYEGFIANTSLNNGAPTFDIYTNNSFILPLEFSAELGFWYQARQLYGFMDVRPNSMLSAGLQKNFLKKKATIKFNAQDIFWNGYPSATSNYTGYREFFVAERDTRQFTLSFTYRFGNRPGGPARRRTGGAEDEKRRAGSGGA
jgi:hypothetical protein